MKSDELREVSGSMSKPEESLEDGVPVRNDSRADCIQNTERMRDDAS